MNGLRRKERCYETLLLVLSFPIFSFSFFSYHSEKDSFSPCGISRCLYQGLSLLFTTNGMLCNTQRPAFPALINAPGFDKVQAMAFMLKAFVLAAYPSFTITWRHLYNWS